MPGLGTGARRVGIALVGFAIAGFVVSRGFTLILRHRPKRILDATRMLFGRVLNPALMWFSDRIGLDQSIMYHVGRTSGREYATPLCVSSTPDGFIVPVVFGPDVDWLRNLRETPEAKLLHEGTTYAVRAQVIDADEALRGAGGSPGCSCWDEFRVQEFVLLRPADAA